MKEKKLDRLAKLVMGADPERLAEAMVKSERVTLRVTMTDKRGMEAMAKVCGMTVTEYITRLHNLAERGLVALDSEGGRRGRG